MKVQSSAIAEIDYDPDQQALTVEFTAGGRHRYAEVPAEIHEQLLASSSVGRAFHTLIKGKFESTKL
jgi:hypothetical protein